MLRHIIHLNSPKKEFARYLRRHHTRGESVLWIQLKAKRFHGLKFRRQVPFGPYIVDFICVEKKLIIEVDGATHDELNTQKRDALRETYLRKQEFTVLRFSDDDVLRSLDEAIAQLEQVLGYSKHESPLPTLPLRGRE